jgi:serine/threonine protein kinase
MNPTDDGRLGNNGVAQRDEPAADVCLARALEEYRERLEAGAAPDRAAFLARHPDIAAELAECLSGLEFVHAVAPALSGDAGANADAGFEPGQPLGDFRLLREVGRGGMGVVYEAEQLSLGRRVALKVLPFAATMDPRQLQRFHNEARAAAALHHTNIVPVHGVGYERGVHFYAMQFIDGQSLAAFLEAERGGPRAGSDQPTTGPGEAAPPSAATDVQAAGSTARAPQSPGYFRRVVEWGIQAAEALDHAHQMGIIHRDVKPANLMLDAAGRLWVTDFGLAQIQTDTHLTMSGDLVGTLRYMSPEQALARRVIIDHRTDVYSLGATLYELLALRPVFEGEDRQELLRQIAFEEPKPPRRINKAIPAELDTIVCKALQKNPADRYATAQELADDLRRWREDRPIQARRPSLVERARKWAARHTALVRAALALAVLTAILAVVSALLVWEAKEETERALHERTLALEQAQEREQEARRNAREAARQQGRADNNFRLAIEEIGQLVQVGEDDPKTGKPPPPEEVRKAQSDRAFVFYQRLLHENRTDPAGRLQAALVSRELLSHYAGRGEATKAAEAYAQAVSLFKQLAAEFPGEALYQKQLGAMGPKLRNCIVSSYSSWAWSERDRGQDQKVATYYEQAITLAEAGIREQPEYNYWLVLSVACHALGQELSASGQTKKADALFTKALESLAKYPRTPVETQLAWRERALTYERRGHLRAAAGRFADAEADYRESLALLEKLAKVNKFWAGFVCAAQASSQEGLGNVVWATGRGPEAKAAFRRAEEIGLQKLRTNPRKDFGVLQVLARFYVNCPDEKFRKPAQAVELAQEALENARKARPYHLRDEVDCWTMVGAAQYRAGNWQAALRAFQQAQKLPVGEQGFNLFFLAMTYWQLGDKDQARSCNDKAALWMNQFRPEDEQLRRLRDEAAALVGVSGKP